MTTYRFRCKALFQGKLRIVIITVPGECDAPGILEELEDIMGTERLAATQLVSVERIEDGP